MIGLQFWHWWVLALVFVVIEALLPSGVMASMAVAGAIVGALFLMFPDLTWQAQLAGFGGLTLAFSFPFTHIVQKKLAIKAHAQLAARQYLGKELVLTMPVRNGFGEIELDGTIWELKGPDIDKGEKVLVTGVDHHILVVRPLKRKTDSDEMAH